MGEARGDPSRLPQALTVLRNTGIPTCGCPLGWPAASIPMGPVGKLAKGTWYLDPNLETQAT